MKRILVIILTLVLLVSTIVTGYIPVSAAETFKEGDIIYLDISSFTSWYTTETVFYANFTDAIKEQGGSIDIKTADKTKYDPKSGLEEVENYVYKYTLTKEDAEKTVMRFWRGNETTLWNYSVLLSAADYASGKNAVLVSGKNGEGSLAERKNYKYSLNAKISSSKSKADVAEEITISLQEKAELPATSTKVFEIYLDNVKVSSNDTYKFSSEKEGAFVFTGKVYAYDNDSDEIKGYSESSITVTVGDTGITALKKDCIFVHGTSGKGNDSEAWLSWKDYDNKKYFYLPTSLLSGDNLEIYNSFSSDASLNGTTLKANETTSVKCKAGNATIIVDNKTYNCVFEFSSAEGAVFVNNVDKTQTGGKELWEYLTQDKEHQVSCTAAVTLDDGSIILEDVKKMKGRGNTSWGNARNPKYGWNLTFNSAIELGSMKSCKKFSLISNFQDASLNRNRFLYDLADEVGIAYASDSRFIDFYVNGEYKGAYMMAEKIDTGKNTLISDIDEDEYLKYIEGTQTDFPFVIELGYPDAGDASTRANDGNYLTMKNPGLADNDPNAKKVLSYVKTKYDTMRSNLDNNAKKLRDTLDIESMSIMYMLNEYCKNWDSGASSVYFVYKKAEDGNYKFFASPVWDYDNSMGNPRGEDKTYATARGWWANTRGSQNIYSAAVKNLEVMNSVYQVWFERFVPAINKFTDQNFIHSGEVWSQDVYYNILKDQAPMNYNVSPMVVDSDWIGNHSSLVTYNATYSYDNNGYINKVNFAQGQTKSYDQYSFKGEYDYMVDWGRSRAAWISNEYIEAYNQIVHPEPQPTEPTIPTEPVTEDPDPEIDTNNALAIWKFDNTGKTSGDKLTEYGNADDGYIATKGTGTLKLSVDGSKYRALEWSDEEYGSTGVKKVPIMSASSKNLWFTEGTPYIEMSGIDSSLYEKLKITIYLAGSNKAPAYWKLQYSVDGNNYKDISNAKVTIDPEKRKIMTAYFDNTSVPDDASKMKGLTFRLIATDKVTVSGGNVDDAPSSGEIAINYISVHGTKRSDSTIRGDANCDGEVSIIDAMAIQKHIAKLDTLSEQGIINANVCDEETLTIVSASKIQKYLAHIIEDL